MSNLATPSQNRLLSLDLYRGVTMFLLLAEAAGLYHAASSRFEEGSIAYSILSQFHHHPWNGLRFWDLIQPFFMFIVGVAMPFSLRNRLKKGDTWQQAFKHILIRCGMLFLFGVGLHCVYSGKLVWELWNVLTQLSFTILVTFLLMRLAIKYQLLASLGFLILTEILYRAYNPSAPFVKDLNFGSWMDQLLMGKINDGGGWVTINCLPTAAHTIWGAVCGQLLLSDKTTKERIKFLVIAGAAALALGYGLDFAGITPIIKRIATTSFVLASGGWCLLVLALVYWVVDVKKLQSGIWVFSIIGMNAIFIYLFAETIGGQWLRGFSSIWMTGIFRDSPFTPIATALLTLGIFWYLCYFLYKHRIFFKI